MAREKETLENAFTLIIEELLKSKMSTAMVAQVSAYDGKNRITAQPVVTRRYKGQDPIPLPPIEDVPVVFPGAGDYWLTFPIEEGSWVLLVCSQRSIDAWKNSDGSVGDASTPRKFSMSDAIAIPGILPFSEGFDVGDGMKLRNKAGNVNIQIDSDVVTITNGNGTIKLGSSGNVSINGHLTVEPE